MQVIELTNTVVSESECGRSCRFRHPPERARVVYEDKGSVRVRFNDEQLAYIPKGTYKIITDPADEAEKTYCVNQITD